MKKKIKRLRYNGTLIYGSTSAGDPRRWHVYGTPTAGGDFTACGVSAEQIEAEGCDYFQDHAITNFELFSSEIEALANAMIFESMPNVWRFRLGEKVSVQAFSSTDEAKQAAVEYLQQAVDPM